MLRTEEDFIILDFEGEPSRPLAERRSRQSPLKDVAGMLRSYSYAAYAALFGYMPHAPDEYSALEPWAALWERWVGHAFMQGYLSNASDVAVRAGRLLPDGDDFQRLLAAFMLDKAFYELVYELNSRPDWVRIPLTGIRRLQ